MEGESTLQVFAEVGVALTGFTGVVAVFGNRAQGGWKPIDLLRFRIMLGSSIATLLLALLPLALQQLGLPLRMLWGLSSGAFVLYQGTVIVLDIRQARRIGAFQDPTYNPWIRRFIGVTASTILVLQLLNVLGVGFEREPGPYLLGLFLLVSLCAFSFVMLLSFVGRTED